MGFPLSEDGAIRDLELWIFVGALALIAIYVAVALLITVPAIAGSYGMLEHKRWARKFVLISALVATLNVPLGTTWPSTPSGTYSGTMGGTSTTKDLVLRCVNQ